jgi:hypothetical protein
MRSCQPFYKSVMLEIFAAGCGRAWLSFGCTAKVRYDGRQPIALSALRLFRHPRIRAKLSLETRHLS